MRALRRGDRRDERTRGATACMRSNSVIGGIAAPNAPDQAVRSNSVMGGIGAPNAADLGIAKGWGARRVWRLGVFNTGAMSAGDGR